jgi:hypothetical protein
VQQVEVDGVLWRPSRAHPLGGRPEHVPSAGFTGKGAPKCRHDTIGVEDSHAQPPRAPSVARSVVTALPRRITMATVSPG